MGEEGQGHSRAMAWLVSLSFTEMYIVGIVVVPEIVVGARGVRGHHGVWVWIGPTSTIAMCYPRRNYEMAPKVPVRKADAVGASDARDLSIRKLAIRI
jgi:hypothetical protein